MFWGVPTSYWNCKIGSIKTIFGKLFITRKIPKVYYTLLINNSGQSKSKPDFLAYFMQKLTSIVNIRNAVIMNSLGRSKLCIVFSFFIFYEDLDIG